MLARILSVRPFHCRQTRARDLGDVCVLVLPYLERFAIYSPPSRIALHAPCAVETFHFICERLFAPETPLSERATLTLLRVRHWTLLL